MIIKFDPQTGKISGWEDSNQPIEIDADAPGVLEIDANTITDELRYLMVDVATKTLVPRLDIDLLKSNQLKANWLRYRNAELSTSDWTQLPDNNLTDVQRQQWRDYRQLLRDAPAEWPEIVDKTFTPTWPARPS